MLYLGVGTAIGAMTGFLLGGISALAGYKTEEEILTEEILKGVEARQKYRDSIEESNKLIEETVNSQLAQIQYTENLVSELDSLVNANGKVKEGYQARVDFILNELNEAYGTQYKLINGEIEDYNELKTKIYEVIKAKKAEVILNANESAYAEAIQNRAKLYADLEQATKDASNAQTNFKNELEKWGLTLEDVETNSFKYLQKTKDMGYLARKQLFELGEAYKQTQEDVEQAANAYEKNNRTIIYWEDLKTATIEGDEEKISEAVKKITSTYETEAGIQQLTLAQQLKEEKIFYEQRLNELEKANVEITEETRKTYSAVYDTIVDSLVEQTKALNSMTPEITEGWKQLATDNIEEYTRRLNELNPTLQWAVQNSTGIIVNELGNAKPSVSEQINEISSIIKELGTDFRLQPKVEVEPKVALKVQDLKTKLQNLQSVFSGMSSSLLNNSITTSIDLALKKLTALGYANGGFPEMGELFMAREAGPELVGRIGSRTAVANNSQIVEAVSRGVYTAVAEAMNVSNNNNGPVKISGKLNGKELIQFTINGINGMKQQTGECPIEIL
ncbi:MAG: hypothetical protein ACI4U9_03570 [Clostridia bacterium]